MFHEDPVGEAADGCRDADGAGAGDVAHVVSLLDPEQLEVAPERGGAVVHPALVDGGHDVEQDLPHVRARVVQELELLVADAVHGHGARLGDGMEDLPEGLPVLGGVGRVALHTAEGLRYRLEGAGRRRTVSLRMEGAERVARQRLLFGERAACVSVVEEARVGDRVGGEARAGL